MDFSKHDYLTPENILAMALPNCGDVECRKLHIGFYHALIQEFLEAVSFDTLFDDKRTDVLMSPDLRIDLEKGTFNVKEVYGYCGALCEPGKMTKLWHKKNYYTQGGRVVAKSRQDGSQDPFIGQHHNYYLRSPQAQLVRNNSNVNNRLHYYNVENGVLMVSSNCKQFEKLHIRSSGIAASLEDVPYIPQVFRIACVDYVSEAGCRVIMANGDDPKKYQYLQQLYEKRLDKEGFNGSWHNAATKIARMSDGEKNDYREYIARWRYL